MQDRPYDTSNNYISTNTLSTQTLKIRLTIVSL